MNYLYVGLGGLLGSVVRYWISGLAATRIGEAFPYGTFFINVTGSFVLGLLVGALAPRTGGNPWGLFLGTGFCGGYTTFSSYTVETLKLVEAGTLGAAGFYFFASPLVGLGAALAGLALGRLV
jgi:CrcB protein